MDRHQAPVPDFDDQRPWGAYAPTAGVALALALSHRMPAALSSLTKLLRRPVKYGWATPLDLEIWGLKLRLLPRGNMSEQKLYTSPKLFDRREFVLLAQRLKPGGVFVDVGANAGIYSFWAHRCMQGRGRIQLRTRVARQVTIARHRWRLALDLHVIDDGPGVPEEIGERIFFPLVSGRDGGSGLGLTLAQTFVQQHGGMIECESKPGRTDFRILLPLP